MNKLKFVLPILLIVNILCMIDVSIMTIVIPEIQTAFNVSLSDLSWTVNVYTIVFAALIIPFGRLAERFGQHRLVYIGIIAFGLGSFITGISPNLLTMLLARGLQSIGAAMIVPTSMVIGLAIGGTENRNKVIAALAGAQGLAVALGPVVGGFVAQYLNWRWVFYINLPFIIGLLIIYPLVLNMRHESQHIVAIDWLGAVLSCIFLTSLSLGLIKSNDWGWTSARIVTLLAVSFSALILFIFQEHRTASPMINLRLFASRNFTASSIALLVCNYLLGGMVILIPTLLTKVQGESEIHAALLITPYSISVMITVILTSLLIKRINSTFIIGLGLVIITISYWFLAHLNLGQNYHRLIIADILLGCGYGLIAATANILVAADFQGSQLTDSQSVANILRQVGFIIAIALFTSLLTKNFTAAKQNTLRYADQQITTQNIDQTLKKQLTTQIAHQLNSQNSTIHSFSKASLPLNQTKIEQQAVDREYQKQLKLLSLKSQLPMPMIPMADQKSLYQKVSQLVIPKTQLALQQTSDILEKTITRIKQHTLIQSRNAFMAVYQIMLFVPIVSLSLLFIFQKRQR